MVLKVSYFFSLFSLKSRYSKLLNNVGEEKNKLTEQLEKYTTDIGYMTMRFIYQTNFAQKHNINILYCSEINCVRLISRKENNNQKLCQWNMQIFLSYHKMAQIFQVSVFVSFINLSQIK